jgi:hypothetical protein
LCNVPAINGHRVIVTNEAAAECTQTTAAAISSGMFSPAQARRKNLRLLKQGLHVWDRVGIAFQTVLIVFSLHFDL